jgi:hypothetical protein
MQRAESGRLLSACPPIHTARVSQGDQKFTKRANEIDVNYRPLKGIHY